MAVIVSEYFLSCIRTDMVHTVRVVKDHGRFSEGTVGAFMFLEAPGRESQWSLRLLGVDRLTRDEYETLVKTGLLEITEDQRVHDAVGTVVVAESLTALEPTEDAYQALRTVRQGLDQTAALFNMLRHFQPQLRAHPIGANLLKLVLEIREAATRCLQ